MFPARPITLTAALPEAEYVFGDLPEAEAFLETVRDVYSVLAAFGEPDLNRTRNVYLERIRLVAEERWLKKGIADLPLWKDTIRTDEIVDAGQHDQTKTCDGE